SIPESAGGARGPATTTRPKPCSTAACTAKRYWTSPEPASPLQDRASGEKLRGADGGKHGGELPRPATPSGELPAEKGFCYSFPADEHQHEGRRVGGDVGVDVTCAPRFEHQRTVVEDHYHASTSAQAQLETGSERSGFLLVHEGGGRQGRDERKHGALDREQSVVTLYRPRAPGGVGDVVAMDQTFLE